MAWHFYEGTDWKYGVTTQPCDLWTQVFVAEGENHFPQISVTEDAHFLQ